MRNLTGTIVRMPLREKHVRSPNNVCDLIVNYIQKINNFKPIRRSSLDFIAFPVNAIMNVLQTNCETGIALK